MNAGCYWTDWNGNCWSYQQVVDWWAERGIDYTTGAYTYPTQQQTVQQTVQQTAVPNAYFGVESGGDGVVQFVMGNLSNPVFWIILLSFFIGFGTMIILLLRMTKMGGVVLSLFKWWGNLLRKD